MQIQIRGTAWRAGLVLLRREGLLDAVVAAAPEATRGLLAPHGVPGQARPAHTTGTHAERAVTDGATAERIDAEWIDIKHFDAVTDALAGLGGDALVRRLGRLGGRDAQPPPLRAAVRLLGVFGAGPQALFGRLGQVTRYQSRGVDASYRRLGDNSGEVRLDYAGEPEPPHSRLVGMAGRFESLFDLAGVRGEVGAPNTNPRRGTTYEVRWD